MFLVCFPVCYAAGDRKRHVYISFLYFTKMDLVSLAASVSAFGVIPPDEFGRDETFWEEQCFSSAVEAACGLRSLLLLVRK